MKRIVSLVLALSMVLSLFTTAFAGTSLKDVEGTKYEAAVSALVELGIVNGYEDDTYRAEKVVTRAEMAKLLVIASGLEAAADLNKGATRFTDVAANHWATGYINVATEYGYVNGYPDGSFAPDATVTYAEAVTMAIRVLGYKSVVESKGTWPTNYIAKASELKALKDVDYKTYSDGATRGNVAILVWNVLRAPMWDVDSESEKDGLNYSKAGTMINKYFDDYTYATVTFDGFEIDEDGKVQVELGEYDEDGDPVSASKKALGTSKYEYAGNDFYKFVEGTEVEVLVNEDDKTLLTIVATEDNTLKDGSKDDIDDKYDELKGNDYDYAYVRTSKKTIKAANVLNTTSIFVDKLEKKADYVKINSEKFGIDGNKYTNKLVTEKTDFDSEVIIKDGKRVSLSDIELGDILTSVEVKGLTDNGLTKIATFYVIGSEEAEGELTRCAEVKYENDSSVTFTQMTVDKKKYVVDTNATYVEDPDAKTIKAVKLSSKDDYKDAMEGEEVVLRLDAVTGKVVRVEFDGKIDSGSEDNTSIKFFGTADSVDKEGKVYSIELENESGKETYEFAKNSDAESEAKAIYAAGTDLTGAFIYVELNDEDKIVNFDIVAAYNDDQKEVSTDDIVYGDKAQDEYYAVKDLNTASYDEDTKTVVDDNDDTNKIKANDNTVLVKVVFDNKGTDKPFDDEYRVEFEEGLSEIKKAIKSEKVVAIYDAAESFVRAKYLVMFDDASDKSDNLIAKVVTPDEVGDPYVGGNMIDLEENDGTESSIKIADRTKDLSDYKLVVYTVTTNAKGKETFNFVAGLNSEELTSDYARHGYVGECSDGRVFLLNDTTEYDLDDYTDDYEDFMVVVVETSELKEEGTFEVSSYDEITYAEIDLEEGDRISIDEKAEVIFVIRGMGIKD